MLNIRSKQEWIEWKWKLAMLIMLLKKDEFSCRKRFRMDTNSLGNVCEI